MNLFYTHFLFSAISSNNHRGFNIFQEFNALEKVIITET